MSWLLPAVTGTEGTYTLGVKLEDKEMQDSGGDVTITGADLQCQRAKFPSGLEIHVSKYVLSTGGWTYTAGNSVQCNHPHAF